MNTKTCLLGLLFVTASVSSGFSAQLGAGPESIMGISAHEAPLYSALNENRYLSVSQLESMFSPVESIREIAIPSLNLDYTGKGTDNFYYLSLINREDDFYSSAGFAFDTFSVTTHYGNSDGSVSKRLHLDGIAPNFFHGSVSYPFNYGGSTLGISLAADLTLHGGASFIEAEGLEGRSIYYSGLSYKGFYATYNQVQRSDENVGFSIGTGLDIGEYSVSYQELNSANDAVWHELSIGLSDHEKLSTLKLSLGIGDNEYYYAGAETRVAMMYSIPLGGKKYSQSNKGALFSGTDSQLANSSTTFQGLKKASLESVGAGLALSSGSEILDRKGPQGFRFKNRNRAARKILSRWNPRSIRLNKEIGSTIYKNRDGTFGINSNVRLGTNDSVPIYPWNDIPQGTKPSAYWHTHGAFDPNYDNENFSYQDIQVAHSRKIDAYLGTPMGRMRLYERRTNMEYWTKPGFLPTN